MNATPRAWVGTTTAWNTAGNWAPSGVPTSADDLTISGAITNQPVITTTAGACRSITTQSGNVSITLNANLSISVGGLSIASPYSLTFAGNRTATINGTTTFGYNASMNISSSTATVTFSAATINLTNGNNLCKVTNSGTLNFTASNANFGYQTSITNNAGGTVNITASTFSIPNSGYNNVTFSNAGTFNITSSTVNLSTQQSAITNTNIFNVSSSNINLGTGNSANITNTSPGVFTINNGSTINISGYQNYITNSGTFYAGTSGSACTINVSGQGNTASPYSITNSGIFNVGSTSAINLTGTDPTNPTKMVTTAGTFTFQSDANGCAILGSLGAGSSAVGTYNIQRYLTGNNNVNYRSYRLLSSPVNISSATNGTGNIDISYVNTSVGSNYGALTAGPGGITNGFTVSSGNPTLYLYDESRTSNNSTFTDGKNVGIVKVDGVADKVSTLSGGVTTNNVSIPVGNGFMFYFIGNNQSLVTSAASRNPENTTITAIGTINQQNVQVKLWKSVTLLATNNLVGNPYPSSIDLKKVYTDNYSVANPIGPIFYELSNVNPGQQYVSYNASTNMTMGTGSSQFVASGQGFFATSSVNGLTITFKESQKATNQLTGASLLMSTPANKIATNGLIVPASSDDISNASFAMQTTNDMPPGLHLAMAQDTVIYDACGIYFTKDGIDKYDRDDAKDLDGISPKVYLSSFTTDGIRTGINSLGGYTKGKRVKLFVKATTDGVYKLNLTDTQNIDVTNYNLYLKDNYTKDSLDLGHNPSYSFRVKNSDTTSFGANRFELVITPKPLPPYALISFTAKKVNEGVLLTWKTANEGNFTGFSIEKQDGSKFTALNNLQSNGADTYSYVDHNPTTGTNAYRLMQNGLEANISYSETVSVLYNANSLNLYPNPAKDNINVYVNAQTSDISPTYQMSIYDPSGTLILTRQVNRSDSQSVSALRIGTYIVRVTDNNGKLIGNTKFSKIQ